MDGFVISAATLQPLEALRPFPRACQKNERPPYSVVVRLLKHIQKGMVTTAIGFISFHQRRLPMSCRYVDDNELLRCAVLLKRADCLVHGQFIGECADDFVPSNTVFAKKRAEKARLNYLPQSAMAS